MPERFVCGVEWDTDRDDEDGDGIATHFCFFPAGHEQDYHLCADHVACAPTWREAAWSAEAGDA